MNVSHSASIPALVERGVRGHAKPASTGAPRHGLVLRSRKPANPTSTSPASSGTPGQARPDDGRPRYGRRLDRHGAGRIVRRIARHAGIARKVGPHTLRHAFITAALDAGVPLRDVQEAASHADPRTTMRYDRARVSL